MTAFGEVRNGNGTQFWQFNLTAPRELAENSYKVKQDLWKLFPAQEVNDRRFLWRNNLAKFDGKDVFLQVRSTVKPVAGGMPKGYSMRDLSEGMTDFAEGENLLFLLTATPTREQQSTHRRLAIKSAQERVRWVLRKFEGVAEVFSVDIKGSDHVVAARDGRVNNGMEIVTFQGALKVLDPELFSQLYLTGFGHNKVWGCGMLSIRRP
jgi:CRISPR-associated protein Cas6/Cse3/CasE subtype I-E